MKHGIALFIIHTYPSQCESQLSSMEKVNSRVAPSSSHTSGSISPLGSTRGGGSLSIPMYQSVSALLHFGKYTTFGSLGLNNFNHPRNFKVSYVFPSHAFTPLVLSKFLAEHVIDRFRPFILLALCCMETPWLSTVINMLKEIPHCCLIIKYLIMDVSVDQMLEGLQSLHLTLWLLRDVCYTDKGSLPQSVWQWQG